MNVVHAVVGLAMTVLFLAAGALGGWAWYRGRYTTVVGAEARNAPGVE